MTKSDIKELPGGSAEGGPAPKASERQIEPGLTVVLPAGAGRPAKRSFSIRGHRTSISLEAPFWEAFTAVAREQKLPLARLVAAIDAARGNAGLSSAIRLYVLDYYRRGRTGG